MKYPIAVRETLEKLVIVEKDSLEEAIDYVRRAYKAGLIVLDAECIQPAKDTGENAEFFEADYMCPLELPACEAEVFDVRQEGE